MITGDGQSMAPTIEDKDPMIVDASVREFTGDGIYAFIWQGLFYIKRLQLKGNDHFKMISDNKGTTRKISGWRIRISRPGFCSCGMRNAFETPTHINRVCFLRDTLGRGVMEFEEKLAALSVKVRQQKAAIQTEEATKNAFVMPFIQNVLGYDVFDPLEVVPEFICDIGTKKGEKIDYAILKDGKIQILIESKKIGESLNINHASQLFAISMSQPPEFPFSPTARSTSFLPTSMLRTRWMKSRF